MSRFASSPAGSLDEFILGLSNTVTYHACPILAILIRDALPMLDNERDRAHLLGEVLEVAGNRPLDHALWRRMFTTVDWAVRVLLPIAMDRHVIATRFASFPPIYNEHHANSAHDEVTRNRGLMHALMHAFVGDYIADALAAASSRGHTWLLDETPRQTIQSHSQLNRNAIRAASATGMAAKQVIRNEQKRARVGDELSRLILALADMR